MRDDDVFFNGTKLNHVLGGSRDPRSLDSFPAIKVPSGHCFLLGDNRHESIDSRQIGPVPLANIIGRVARVL